MRRHIQVTAAFVIIGALVLTLINFSREGSNVKAPMALADYYSQELQWEDCYEDFQCSILDVPIDYSDLSVGTFEISVLRYPAADQKKRIGSLIINPGGPGSSGVNYAYNAEFIFSPDITDRYDIVGFDPRGVAESAPISCLSDSEIDANYAADGKPDNAAELAQTIAETKKYAEKCLDQNEYLTSYGTANAARDMDLLRQALGDAKLNYMGKSYGTFMGALYATLFPEKIGRVVLDGAVDPTISPYEQALTQAVSFDNSLTDFLQECSKKKNCALPSNVDEARRSIIDLLAATAKKPIPLKNSKDDKRQLTETLLTLGMAAAFYDSEEGWPKLRDAFREVKAGYGDEFIKLADQYSGRLKDGTYRSNEFDSGAIIDCLDFSDTRTVDEITTDAKKISQLAPVFGPYLGYAGLTCKFLPKTTPVTITTIKPSAPIMIIGTTRDPATPYQWAVSLQKIIANSQLLTLVGDGHTGHNRGSACIDGAVDNFYLKGVLPAKNLRCIASS